MKFQEMCDQYENTIELLRKENAELRAKAQGSDLRKVKQICNRMCGSCRFFNHNSTGCLFKACPDTWHIDFILEKLNAN